MIKIALVILLAPALGFAESLNFNQIFKATRIGSFVDQHYNRLAGVYTTALSFHDAGGLEYVNLNVGYVKSLEDQKDSPLFQVGLRLDNLMARLLNTDWGRAHTTLTPLPHLEFGPFASGFLEKRDGAHKVNLLYGAGIAIGL